MTSDVEADKLTTEDMLDDLLEDYPWSASVEADGLLSCFYRGRDLGETVDYLARVNAVLNMEPPNRETVEQALGDVAKLATLSDIDLIAHYEFVQLEKAAKALERNKEAARLVKEQQRSEEASMFFNTPASTATFDPWLKRKHWTVEQAIALSLGKNPDLVNSQSLETVPAQTHFEQLYARRKEQLNEALAHEHLQNPLVPAKFILWARDEMSWELSTELGTLQGAKQDTRPNPKEEHTSQKLIIGIAARYFDFDPSDSDSPERHAAPQAISNALKDVGIDVDVKTIRTHLQKGIAWAIKNDCHKTISSKAAKFRQQNKAR